MSTTATETDVVSSNDNFVNLRDTEALALLNKRLKLTQFQDLDLKFTRNPNTGDLMLRTGGNAVKQAIKNLILTDYYERPFQPGIGSGIRQMLFEPADFISERRIEDEIRSTIENFEPRAEVLNVQAKARFDGHGYDVAIVFNTKNSTEPITFTTFLERARG